MLTGCTPNAGGTPSAGRASATAPYERPDRPRVVVWGEGNRFYMETQPGGVMGERALPGQEELPPMKVPSIKLGVKEWQSLVHWNQSSLDSEHVVAISYAMTNTYLTLGYPGAFFELLYESDGAGPVEVEGQLCPKGKDFDIPFEDGLLKVTWESYEVKISFQGGRFNQGLERREEVWIEDDPFSIGLASDYRGAYLELMVQQLVWAGSPAALPFGGSNDRYNHHTFWDSDVWGFPALALTKPEIAKKQPEFRYSQRRAAEKNFEKWKAAGYPVAAGGSHQPMAELVQLAGGVKPMMYPWETINGDELSPNPDTKFQHHVTGGVAWMMHRAIQLALVDRAKGEEVIQGCAAFYLWRMDQNPDGSYGLRGVVSPDEWHTVDNDLYTNAIADWTIRRAFGSDVWPRGKVKFPRRDGTFATFDGDDYNEYQQAAALLAVFPLQHPDIEPEAAKMYALYRGKYSKNGPAMSSAIDAVVAARIGKAGEADEDFAASWEPYAYNPALEFREKPGIGESYFLTGAAACVNAAIYGMWGVRIQDDKPKIGEVAIRLDGGGWLTVHPLTPANWGSTSCILTVNGKELIIGTSGFSKPGEDFSVVYDGKIVKE